MDGRAVAAFGRIQLVGQREGPRGQLHADRDARFRYPNALARAHQQAGGPVVSVDAKK